MHYPLGNVLSGIAGALIACAPAMAALEWRETTITVPMTAPTMTVAEGAFHFRNGGDKAVTIESVRASCSCTAATPDKTVYQPGEEGVITAKLNLQRGSGLVQKTIAVSTDEAATSSYQLTLGCQTRGFLTVDKCWLMWYVGEPATPVVVRATVDWDQPIHITAVRSSGNRFTHELTPIRDGWEYELRVTPTAVGERCQEQLNLVTDFGAGETYSVGIRANVGTRPNLTKCEDGFFDRLSIWFAHNDWASIVAVAVATFLLGMAARALVCWARPAAVPPPPVPTPDEPETRKEVG